MTTFLTGCTHFGHANIIKLANRPFSSVEEMDEELARRWNETVRPEDKVYHHGDFAFSKRDDFWEYSSRLLARLNGYKVLIRGNHDPLHWGANYVEVQHGKTLVCMFHYPIEEWNGFYRNSVHTHCHTHKKEQKSAPRRYNVGVDANDFRPVSIDHVVERLL